MSLILIVTCYFALIGWAIYETTKTYTSHTNTKKRQLKKLTQTLFMIFVLFLIGHSLILIILIHPDWIIPETALWFYYGFNFILLRGMHILRVELTE